MSTNKFSSELKPKTQQDKLKNHHHIVMPKLAAALVAIETSYVVFHVSKTPMYFA